MMDCERSFTDSKNLRVTVLFTALWAVSVIVNATEVSQHEKQVDLKNETFEQRSDFEELTNQTANSTLKIAERNFLGLLFGPVKKLIKQLVLDLVVPPYVNESQGPPTCYKNVCFFAEYGLGLRVGGPKNPEEDNTTFIFFDGRNSSGEDVNETTWEAFFTNYSGDISKPLVAIVHGLNGTRKSPWAVSLREALFENVNCNVLVVDWNKRAVFPYYARAASGALLVGVRLSMMLQKIIETSNCSLEPSNVHLIGFSLGAHAAGVCGRHFYNTTNFMIGRITGLDPAGPLFEHSNVCLSTNDADFVDVIHTNAGSLSKGMFGLNESIGHVDFYPNGGTNQPGCKWPEESEDPGCSHKRAQVLYIESLFKNCTFRSYYCEDGWDEFKSGKCTPPKNTSYIGQMGFYSFNATGRGNQYLNTSKTPPYCRNETEA